MLFAKLDLEVLDDPVFLELQDVDPGHPWRFLRLVQIAKRNGAEAGVIQRSDGSPITPRQLARLHDPRLPNGEQVWADFLQLCVDCGLLLTDGINYTISHWRRWHSSPSDEREATRERQRQSRLKRELKNPCHELSRVVTSCHESENLQKQLVTNVTSCHELSQMQNCDNSDCHECHELSRVVTNANCDKNFCHECHETEQSRAEHNRAEQSITEQSITEQSSQSTRARARGATDGRFLDLGKKILEELESGARFSASREADVCSIADTVGTPSFGGETVRPDDVRNAMLMAARLTRERRNGDGVKNPWRYWLSTAMQKVHDCVEARFTHELQQKSLAQAAGGKLERTKTNRGDAG